MADTKIEWTEKSWNPVTGCTKVSAGCDNCYADIMARRFAGRNGYWPAPNHFLLTIHEDRLLQPIRWKTPRRIFVCSMGDLFHDAVPFEFIDKVWAVMAACPQHTFQVPTKRPQRMAEYTTSAYLQSPGFLNALDVMGVDSGPVYREWCKTLQNMGKPNPVFLPNVHLGTSVENQATANERIPHLLRCPAAVRFLSCEPLLGAVDLSEFQPFRARSYPPGSAGSVLGIMEKIHWVICGGESGPKARPMHPAWPRSLRDQCHAAGVPFFFKQWGEWSPCQEGNWHGMGPQGKPPQLVVSPSGETCGGFLGDDLADQRETEGWRTVQRIGKKTAGRLLDGKLHDEYPVAENG